MKVLLLLLATAVVSTLTEARSRRSVGTLTLKANPRAAVEGVTPEVRLDCRPAPTVKQVLLAVLIHLERIDENGTISLVASQRINTLVVQDKNRTEANGYLQADPNDEGSYLTTIIENPTQEDAGTYQCRLVYIDQSVMVHTLGAKVNVTVSDLPEAQYFQEPSGCGCEEVLSEIESLKAAIAVRNEQPAPVPAQSYDEKCRSSFSARFASRHGYAILGDQTALFDAVISNKGGAYSPSTGEFTAPCDGQYFFTATLRSHQVLDAGYVDGLIVVDNEARARTSVFTDAALDIYQSATNGAVLSLNAGQKVKVVVKTTSSGDFVGDEYSVFSGFFLFP